MRVELKERPQAAMPKLENIPGVRKVIHEETQEGGWSLFTLRVESGADVREHLGKAAIENRWALRELRRETATLEDVFVEMTQNEHSAA